MGDGIRKPKSPDGLWTVVCEKGLSSIPSQSSQQGCGAGKDETVGRVVGLMAGRVGGCHVEWEAKRGRVGGRQQFHLARSVPPNGRPRPNGFNE